MKPYKKLFKKDNSYFRAYIVIGNSISNKAIAIEYYGKDSALAIVDLWQRKYNKNYDEFLKTNTDLFYTFTDDIKKYAKQSSVNKKLIKITNQNDIKINTIEDILKISSKLK